MLKSIFTWWNGATWGIRSHIGKHGVLVGEDEFGNRYYEAKTNYDSYDDRKRRYVMYRGYAEATKVPPEWQGWLHFTYDELPSETSLPRRKFEKAHVPNLTGSIGAWRPQGSIARGGERPAASGDYEAWIPE